MKKIAIIIDQAMGDMEEKTFIFQKKKKKGK